MRNLDHRAMVALPGFTIGFEVQTPHPETNERFTIPAAMVPDRYLLNITNLFPDLLRPSWPLVEANKIDLAVLRLGVGCINDRKLARAKMRRAVVISDGMQDAAGRNVIEHREGSDDHDCASAL
jgi:hypothetical protein